MIYQPLSGVFTLEKLPEPKLLACILQTKKYQKFSKNGNKHSNTSSRKVVNM